MLCSNCYKKIPEGEEVAKTTGFWKTRGWGRYGNEIYCKKCAKHQDKKDLAFMVIFFSIWLIFAIVGIVVFIIVKSN